MERLTTSEYDWLRKHAPLVGVELIVREANRFLVCRRCISPGKNKWALPGGRVFKNETLLCAVRRVAKQELGIEVKVERQIAITESFFRKYHYVVVEYLVSPLSDNIVLECQHSAFRWSDTPEILFESRAREVIETCLT